MVKLDAMENPYQWPDDIKAQWLALLAQAQINRYPDPSARQVSERLRAVMGVAEQHEIILGNGSDEIILLLAMLVADGQQATYFTDGGAGLCYVPADCGNDRTRLSSRAVDRKF